MKIDVHEPFVKLRLISQIELAIFHHFLANWDSKNRKKNFFTGTSCLSCGSLCSSELFEYLIRGPSSSLNKNFPYVV